jgi:hypothetical protein
VTGEGLPLWLNWLEERHRARVALGTNTDWHGLPRTDSARP